MILHPGVISLITGSFIVTLMMIYSSLLGIKILNKWDINSSSSVQLSLERRTYLISTIMNYVLGFVILSSFLFIYTADDIHRLFVGAMCATGSLNANPVGWKVLYTKIMVFFIALIWISLNHVDQKAEDYPLVRTKYTILLLITPLVIYDAYLQFKYFMGLKPNIIVSCCGSLFNEGEGGVAGSLSSLPIKPMMMTFYAMTGLFLINAVLSLRFQNGFFKYTSAMLSPALFFVSIASIISFISLYFYEIPTHHCPFDIIQRDYNFIGYPLYITLFSGVFFGMLAGILEPFKKIASLNTAIQESQKKWTVLSIVLISIFTIICSWPIIFSDFTLEGYF
jgi:hypothetical protein